MSTFGDQRVPRRQGFDPIRAMSALDHERRANLVGTIVGHPSGTPSRKELKYYNPSIPESTLSGQLEKLETVGVVESAEKDRAGLRRGEPYRFYRLTDEARDLFERNDIFGADPYKNLFEQVEKTDEIRAAEQASRPAFE
ncbi:hypothetical protein SAMN04487949_2074 [Halogranum gelatinilyticum]|uniref:Uncharacterized protein n=1 Tax=Halogranum gelatinilyticum TaxID=660521 RepID=A0A1G9U7A6_9EURY|nr:transcriptional regulator [Halogranum gelatinilyticum]SDM55857.1 hypothetical protein SAMN04487949_2074 [Halogranum gelatinilyticum]